MPNKVKIEKKVITPAVAAVTETRVELDLSEEEAILVTSLLGKTNSVGNAIDPFPLYNALDDALSAAGVDARYKVTLPSRYPNSYIPALEVNK